jgi:hypothetical protein
MPKPMALMKGAPEVVRQLLKQVGCHSMCLACSACCCMHLMMILVDGSVIVAA